MSVESEQTDHVSSELENMVAEIDTGARSPSGLTGKSFSLSHSSGQLSNSGMHHRCHLI